MANKSSRIARERVDAPMQEGSNRVRERAANTVLPAVRRISQCIPDDHEEELTTQHEKEVRRKEDSTREQQRCQTDVQEEEPVHQCKKEERGQAREWHT